MAQYFGDTMLPASHFLEEIPTEAIFEHRDTRREDEDKNRAAYLHGNRVDWGLALYDRVSTPGVLEGCSRDSVVAVLFGSSLQLVGALTAETSHF